MNDYSQSTDESHNSSMLLGFVLGAAVGAGIALLMAPATGEQTRQRIGDVARRVRREAGHRFEQARDTIGDLKEDAKAAVASGRETFSRSRKDVGTDYRSRSEPPGSGA